MSFGEFRCLVFSGSVVQVTTVSVMRSIPVESELKTGENDFLDVDASLKTNRLHSLVWFVVREVCEVFSYESDLKVFNSQISTFAGTLTW